MDYTKPPVFSKDNIICEFVNRNGIQCKNEAIFVIKMKNYCHNDAIITGFFDKIEREEKKLQIEIEQEYLLKKQKYAVLIIEKYYILHKLKS